MKGITLLSGILLMVALLSGCAPKVEPAKEPGGARTLPAETPVAARESWQTDWARALSAGRTEGRVVIYTTMRPEGRQALSEELKNRFGIELEFIAGQPPALVAKISNERRAGLFYGDVYITGPQTMWAGLGKSVLQSPEKYLILPEVTDPKVWYGGKLLWMDQERTFLQWFTAVQTPLTVNTDLVRPGEIHSYAELLNPKWKERIIAGDPKMGAGAGATWYLMTEVMGWDFVRAFTRQEPIVMQDARMATEWVARGKYPMSIGLTEPFLLTDLQKMGNPIDAIIPKEGALLTQATGAITVLDRSPHPNATAVLLNWLLTREGQTLMTINEMRQSARLDVPTGHLPDWARIRPGVPYFNTGTEERLAQEVAIRDPVSKILGTK